MYVRVCVYLPNTSWEKKYDGRKTKENIEVCS